ncbi:MAG: exodeoxyribonuclease VII large subunit, partial [Candidatus Binatia bacterium]
VDPTRRLQENQVRLDELSVSLWRRFQNSLERFKDSSARLSERLRGLSPLAVLERGYSIVYRLPDRLIVKDSSSVKTGDLLSITFARGSAVSRVEESE